MNSASVPALGSDPHIFLQASSHVCHMLRMSPIAAKREIVPRDEGRGPKGGRGEGQRQEVRSPGPWKGRECRKMQGKEGTLGWWWWGCRELTSTPRKREKKMDDARMRTRTRAAPHQNRDSGIVSLRMAFNPGKVRRAFLGASIEGAHWTGGWPSPESSQVRSVRFRIAGREQCGEHHARSGIHCQVAPRTRRHPTRDDGWGPLFSRGASKHCSTCARGAFVGTGKGAASSNVWVEKRMLAV